MLETLRKQAEQFAIKDASKKATEEMMNAIKPYVEGEMRKMEAEFKRMGTYINSLENRIIQLEKTQTKAGELQSADKR
jgi:hypothetical protein